MAILSKISFTNEFKIAIALLEIPVSGCTCLRTKGHEKKQAIRRVRHNPLIQLTFEDVGRVCFLSRLFSLLLFAFNRCRGLGSLLGRLSSLRWFGGRLGSSGCGGFAARRSWFRCHFRKNQTMGGAEGTKRRARVVVIGRVGKSSRTPRWEVIIYLSSFGFVWPHDATKRVFVDSR